MSDLMKQHEMVQGPKGTEVIPSWTPDFSETDLKRQVCDSKGMWMGFHIKDILPWRRWAVDPKTGKTINQDTFERKLQDIMAIKGADPDVIKCAAIPHVDRYVNAKVDFQNHIVSISNYLPLKRRYEIFDPDASDASLLVDDGTVQSMPEEAAAPPPQPQQAQHGVT